MKIVITGHCGGIGKSINDLLISNGHTVIGFDIKNGEDLNNLSVQQNLFNELVDADVFINNVYLPNLQTSFLQKSIEMWKDFARFVINVNSALVYIPNDVINHRSEIIIYKQNKITQLEISRNFDGKLKILNIMPGWVDTELGRNEIKYFFPGQEHTVNLLSPNAIADIIAYQIDNIDKFHIKELLVESS
jgi:NADP-dependent 3-hydroxy acid dehydrogenase YdfG